MRSTDIVAEKKIHVLHLPISPFSERVRWVLDHKQVAHTKETYSVGQGEELLVQQTGQRHVPVLFVEGEPLPDSTAIVDWLESFRPHPRLVPDDPTDAAQVRLYEELGHAVLAPEGRQLVIGRMLATKDERIVRAGHHFQAKYGYSESNERRAKSALRRALGILAARVAKHRYLVGDGFTRADLTVAAMLLDVVPPAEDLFACDPPWMRTMMTDVSMASDVTFAAVWAWRDRIYRDHRHERVVP